MRGRRAGGLAREAPVPFSLHTMYSLACMCAPKENGARPRLPPSLPWSHPNLALPCLALLCLHIFRPSFPLSSLFFFPPFSSVPFPIARMSLQFQDHQCLVPYPLAAPLRHGSREANNPFSCPGRRVMTLSSSNDSRLLHKILVFSPPRLLSSAIVLRGQANGEEEEKAQSPKMEDKSSGHASATYAPIHVFFASFLLSHKFL